MRSLRSRLVVASVLWTAGLLMLMHMLSMLVIHVFPRMRGAHSWFAVLGAFVLMGAGLQVARGGLASFRELGGRLAAVRAGRAARVEGAYASEVQPLVEELNGLLEDRERAVQRAFATAGDLAHGLRTPLAVLAQMEVSAEAHEQVERMARQVNYHLARARAAASGSSGSCLVGECVDGLARTMRKLHAGRSVVSRVGEGFRVRVQVEDLEEMLGNLLENACKWGKRVEVSALAVEGRVELLVDDDGPGVAEELRTAVLERGVRMDEATPGSGLGLAIVRDLAEVYGGAVSLETSPFGGLRARLALPGGG